MFKLNQKSFLIVKPTIYDIRANIPPEKRLDLLKRLTYHNKQVNPKSGTTDTNPYKEHFDVILAERRDILQKYEDSILWSPRYTPMHFTYLFFIPSIIVISLMLYLRFNLW